MAVINGTPGNDNLLGTPADDQMFGFAGDDTLSGLGGNDLLDGGLGRDSMAGGEGDDDYYVDDAGDTISEAFGQGSDRLFASVSYQLGAGAYVEMMATTDAAGVGAINLTGNDFDQIIYGNAGDNILDGGQGTDTLVGGAGNDTLIGGAGAANTLQGGTGDDVYFVSNASDTIVEADGEGLDQIRTSLVAYTLAGNSVEQLVYTGATAFTGTGNAIDNLIIGGGGDDVLSGLAGNDTLIGGAGTDTLSGGTGNNTLQGGTGNDVYIVSSAGDSVIENAGEGTDAVRTDLAKLVLSANVENLFFTGAGNFTGTGNALANFIVGGSGADELNGADGDDTLVGGAGSDMLIGGTGNNALQGGTGNDIYIVTSAGDSVFEAAGEGTDQVRTTLASYSLGANVEELSFTGIGNFIGNGNALANLIIGGAGADELNGVDGDDTIVGNAGSDLITGGEGNDTLSGNLGNDILNGGNGADRFVFDSALGPNNIDTVSNFTVGQDRILLDNSVFTTLADGPLPASAFVTGSAAADADDRIIYNSATGALFYDADGSGAGAAVQFASLPSGIALSASDFVVI
jgi:Ca2+-binding RTX toxin-like protein